MGEETEQNDLEELKALLARNSEAIQTLRQMVENMEVLLAQLSELRHSAARDTERDSEKGPSR